jgi:SAM-dependent methyltransferase
MSEKYQRYWDTNIEKWGELYLDISHGDETLNAPPWVARLYNRTIARLEAKLMRERYARTIEFLDASVGRGSVFADIGCGTGIFVVEALKRGATVMAIDFSAKALEVSRENVLKHMPEGSVSYHQLDIVKQPIPSCDVALAMGVTPYLRDLSAFMDNVLPYTKLLCCQFTDPHDWANRLRTLVPALNVRDLIFHAPETVDRLYSRHAWAVRKRGRFASGFIDVASPIALDRRKPGGAVVAT